MSERKSIEVTADSVDEAIANGLKQLEAAPGDVIVEVIDEPSRGVFGIGARPAKVRLQLLRSPMSAPPPASVTPPTAPAPTSSVSSYTDTEDRSEQRERGDSRGESRGESRGRSGDRDSERPSGGGQRRGGESRPGGETRGGGAPRSGSARRGGSNRSEGEARERSRPSIEDDFTEEDDLLAFTGELVGLEGEAAESAQIARTVLVELLQKMGMRGFEVNVSQSEASEPGENPPLLLNVEGQNLDNLIGRRGDALSSLQYVTRLIASRRLQRRANIVIDVGGYKLKRSQKLRELALRMADQAVEQARIIYLEPMPPHERRMIHMALRNHPEVMTKSTGEGDARKVTIVPK